jgi:hypothetical protein
MVRNSVAEILEKDVTFALKCIDRMYLNAYVPSLQRGSGFVWFLKTQLGCRVPSTAMIAPQSRAFAEAFESFAREHDVDLVTFTRGERKDDVLRRYLAAFPGDEDVLFVGKAQEKASVFRTEKRTDAQGQKYPWIIRSTAMVTHYYVYILDRDLGPLFLKFCTYSPYPAKLCLNGHEWLKRQLTRKRLRFEPLDNGLRSAASLARVPHPFTPAQRAAGLRQRDLRAHVAALQGRSLAEYGPGALSYDLRRRRLHDLIERIPKMHRYPLTATGLRTAPFVVRLSARALRPALASDASPRASRAGHAAYQRLETAMDAYLEEVHLAA